MGTFEFLMILTILVCALVVLVILAQNPKGGGLSSSFGGGGGQMFGVKQTNDFLDRSTWTLGAVIVGLIILASTMKPNPNASYNTGSNIEAVAPAASEVDDNVLGGEDSSATPAEGTTETTEE